MVLLYIISIVMFYWYAIIGNNEITTRADIIMSSIIGLIPIINTISVFIIILVKVDEWYDGSQLKIWLNEEIKNKD